DLELTGDRPDLVTCRRRDDGDRVATPAVRLHQRARLWIDRGRDALCEDALADLLEIALGEPGEDSGRSADETGEADVSEPEARPCEQRRQEPLRAHAPVDDRVAHEFDRREAGNQGTVDVEEGRDSRPRRRPLDLLDHRLVQHRTSTACGSRMHPPTQCPPDDRRLTITERHAERRGTPRCQNSAAREGFVALAVGARTPGSGSPIAPSSADPVSCPRIRTAEFPATARPRTGTPIAPPDRRGVGHAREANRVSEPSNCEWR